MSENRFVYHAFYLNGHLLTGAMILMAAGALWLLWRGDPLRTALMVMVISAISTVVVTRAEGSLSILLVVIPALVSDAFSRRERQLLLGWLAGIMATWFGFGVWLSWVRDEPWSLSTLAQLLVALVLGVCTLVVGHPAIDRRTRPLLMLAELGLWLLVVALVAAMGPAVATNSLTATVENQLGAGKWGVTVLALGVAVVLVVATRSLTNAHVLRFPVTTFLPMVIALAYLREGAYRVGINDSLNRMWIQILPLAVAYVVVALASGRWRPWIVKASDTLRRRVRTVRGSRVVNQRAMTHASRQSTQDVRP